MDLVLRYKEHGWKTNIVNAIIHYTSDRWLFNEYTLHWGMELLKQRSHEHCIKLSGSYKFVTIVILLIKYHASPLSYVNFGVLLYYFSLFRVGWLLHPLSQLYSSDPIWFLQSDFSEIIPPTHSTCKYEFTDGFYFSIV